MKVVMQRVSNASVEVDGTIVGKAGLGLLLLVGAEQGDSEKDASYLADKCLGLRVFEDRDGKMNLSVQDIGGDILSVSQFTLAGDVSKGRRPSFSDAMEPERANELFIFFIKELKKSGLKVETGMFGARMDVSLINNGPVTFILNSK